MMKRSFTAATLAGILALAACQQAPENGTSDTVQPDATDSPMPVEPDGGIGDGATALPTPAASDTTATASIPEALRGRWGMVAADCTSTRGDAKGLIEIGANDVKFYESRATLGEVKERDANHLRAAFGFSGEGMTWDRDMTFDLQDGGKVLIRREYGEDALPGPQRYNKCA